MCTHILWYQVFLSDTNNFQIDFLTKDGDQTGTLTPSHIEPGSYGNEEWLHIS